MGDSTFPAERPPAVAIQTLGAFRVWRDGRAVPSTEWRSRKARDVLKILVARRGRPTPRDLLVEALWPGGDPARTPNRLSVALSTLRLTLDPAHRYGRERFIASDKGSVRVRLAAVAVDVESFLADAEAGLRLHRRGRHAEAWRVLEATEALYAGDFVEENAYEDWAIALREEARAAYLAVAAALGELALASRDHDAAIRYRLRSLARDRYDERAHLALVSTLAAAGRYGEAERAYGAYVARMEAIGVDAAPYAVCSNGAV